MLIYIYMLKYMHMEVSMSTTRRPIGYWFRHLHVLLEEVLDGTVAAEGLTRRHWQLFHTIANGTDTRAGLDAALAPFTQRGDEPLAPLIDDLANRGWVTAEEPLHLTEDGERAHAALRDKVFAQRAEISKGISPEEYATTVAVLERMANTLEAMR